MKTLTIKAWAIVAKNDKFRKFPTNISQTKSDVVFDLKMMGKNYASLKKIVSITITYKI